VYRPMLAVTSPTPFDDPGWSYELKWDGFRAIVATGPVVRVFGRRTELTRTFPEMADIIGGLPWGAVLDGELVALDDDGRPSFYRLRQADRRLTYVVFDILEIEGTPVISEPLSMRRERLVDLVGHEPSGGLVVSRHQAANGRQLFAAVAALGLEGVMAKRLDSPYLPGQRSHLWQKFLNVKEALVDVVGIEETPAHAWVAHVEERGVPRGRVPIPDAHIPKRVLQDVTVIRRGRLFTITPPLAAGVRYREITPDGFFRHPQWRGFRLRGEP